MLHSGLQDMYALLSYHFKPYISICNFWTILATSEEKLALMFSVVAGVGMV